MMSSSLASGRSSGMFSDPLRGGGGSGTVLATVCGKGICCCESPDPPPALASSGVKIRPALLTPEPAWAACRSERISPSNSSSAPANSSSPLPGLPWPPALLLGIKPPWPSSSPSPGRELLVSQPSSAPCSVPAISSQPMSASAPSVPPVSVVEPDSLALP